MAEIGFGQAPVKLSKVDRGLVRVFVPGATDRIEYADSGQKGDGFAGGCEQLFDSFLVVSRLAQDPVVQDSELIRTDHERLPGIGGDGLGFLAGKMGRQRGRCAAFVVGLVDVGRNGLVAVEEAIQQTAPVR